MVTELATGWAFGKVADLLWDGAKGTLQDRLTRTDLERAMSAGLQAATEWNQDQPARAIFLAPSRQQIASSRTGQQFVELCNQLA